MAELLTNKYDILFPCPPALKEIAAIAIAVQLWRQEMNMHRIKNTLNKITYYQNILQNYSMPRLPPTILRLIEKYAKRVGTSIEYWLEHHSKLCLFDHYRQDKFKSEILSNFSDVVGDFEGLIHYVWTAKRIVLCDRIDEIIRFKIACLYCFEDEILRIWPSVSSRVTLKNTSFTENPLLCYWVFRLKNQLYKLPRANIDGLSIEERILRIGFSYPRSTLEYFWNRLDVGSQTRIKTDPPVSFDKYYRYFLTKFNEEELDGFVNAIGYRMLDSFLFEGSYISRSFLNENVNDRTHYIMVFWQYMKNKMNRHFFFRLVQKIIQKVSYSRYMLYASVSTCCKLWNSASDHLKSHAIQELLLENSLFEMRVFCQEEIDVSFLLTVLSDASAEDRNAFWDKYWRRMVNVFSTRQLDQLMSLCFNNDENEIIGFKLNSLSVLENIRDRCSKLLNDLSVEELNEFLDFCCSDAQRRKNIRLNLLLEDFEVNKNNIDNVANVSLRLNDFINDDSDDVNLAADFKTRFLFSPSTVAKFRQLIDSCIYYGSFHQIVRFIDTFAPSEQVALDFKRLHLLPMFKQMLQAGNYLPKFEDNEFLLNFLLGCLGSDDEIAKFRETLPIDEIVQNVMRNAVNKKNGLKYNSVLVQFLEWHFVTPQALEEFKSRYADDDEFTLLTTKE